MRVAAPPQDGRANTELLRRLATLLGVSTLDLRIVSGAAGRDKLIEVDGLTPAEVSRRLTAE